MTAETKRALRLSVLRVLPYVLAVMAAVTLVNSVVLAQLVSKAAHQAKLDRAAQLHTQVTATAACLRTQRFAPELTAFFEQSGFFSPGFIREYRATIPKTCGQIGPAAPR